MRKITQEDFEDLLDELKQKKLSSKNISVANYLRKKGYEPILENINFFVPGKTVTMIPLNRADSSLASATTVPRRTDILTNLDFSGCDIIKCQFDECDVSGSNWSNQCVRNCSFNNIVMDHSVMENVQFLNCHFEKSSLNYSMQSNIFFEECEFLSCSFNKLNQFDHIEFMNSDIQLVSLLGGEKANNVCIKNTDETSLNTIKLFTDQQVTLFNTKNSETKPAVLVCWNNIAPLMSSSLTEKMLSEHAINSLRMDIMIDVNPAALDQEINRINLLTQEKMQQLKSSTAEYVVKKMKKENIDQSKYDEVFANEWKKQCVSFPMLMMQIMRDSNATNSALFPEMNAIYRYAKTLFDQVEGIILTGGQDIDPRFYGEQQHPKTGLPTYKTHPQITDPRRDLLEFMLVYIQQRASHPKPICGICRGSQVLAVSYGATFYQELDSPERRQYLIEAIERNPRANHTALYSTSKTLADAEEKGGLNVGFMHHQGYSLKTAHGLEETAAKQTSGGPRITIVSEHLQQNITAVQAHIEYYVDKDKDSTHGFSPHVSAEAAESIFGQFAMRVESYSQRVRTSCFPLAFFSAAVTDKEKSSSLEKKDLNCG